jgi:hypothetical protein
LVQVVHIEVTAKASVSPSSCFLLTPTLSMYFETSNFYRKPRYLHVRNIQIRTFPKPVLGSNISIYIAAEVKKYKIVPDTRCAVMKFTFKKSQYI